MSLCGACSTELPPDARFCPACGTPTVTPLDVDHGASGPLIASEALPSSTAQASPSPEPPSRPSRRALVIAALVVVIVLIGIVVIVAGGSGTSKTAATT